MFGLGRTDGTTANAATSASRVHEIDASTPWVAAADGDLPLLQASLAQLGLNVAAQDENGYTLLQAAVSYNQAHVWQWLATQPHFALMAVDREGDSALHYACTLAAAQFLVEQQQQQQAVCTDLVGLRNHENQTALERKRQEVEELRQDEDFEETDEEYVQLVAMVEYLASLTTAAQ